MKMLFVALAVMSFWTPIFAQQETPKQTSKAPFMVSLADLQWTELAERKGSQIAVLSGDSKKGEYTAMRKVPAGTDNPLHTHSSEIKNVMISGVWYTGQDAASAKTSAPDRSS